MQPQPQSGIFAFGTVDHCYLELDLASGGSLRELASRLARLFAKDTPLVAVSVVVGLRPELWADLHPEVAPADVRSFEPVGTGDGLMPATQHDAWVWLAGARRDAVFDSALATIRLLDGVALVAKEITGWGYQRNRDLTGFIDGTENPPAGESVAVAVAQSGVAAGSSVLLFQQWEHLPTFAALPTDAQEAVIGRTKPDSVELDAAVMPADSHVSRTVVEEDGEELAIFRRNTAWGGPTEHGTVFVGLCATQHPLQVMLERMMGIPDGVRDALTHHAVARTGAYYVVPSLESFVENSPDGKVTSE